MLNNLRNFMSKQPDNKSVFICVISVKKVKKEVKNVSMGRKRIYGEPGLEVLEEITPLHISI